MPHLTAEDQVAAMPQIADSPMWRRSTSAVDSSELTISDLIALSERMAGAVAGGSAGAQAHEQTRKFENRQGSGMANRTGDRRVTRRKSRAERMRSIKYQQGPGREFSGYGADPPDPRWPGRARIADTKRPDQADRGRVNNGTDADREWYICCSRSDKRCHHFELRR